jgi:hypothetical protein
MPATRFICPNGGTVSFETCLAPNGCQSEHRCSTVPYLRHVSNQRPFTKVSPSSAGNGARMIYLKAIHEYAIAPYAMTWAVLGTAVHGLLAKHGITNNTLEEQFLQAANIKGTADLLEMDERSPGAFCLTDYKTFGSYKVAKCLGVEKVERFQWDEKGNLILLKSGKNKGKPKTKKVFTPTGKPDLANEMLQLNQYRILFESSGFPVSRMQLQVIVRDGGLYIAKSRGVFENLYIIPIPRMKDSDVVCFYANLQKQVDEAFKIGWAPKCSDAESWGGRRCEGYCEIVEHCKTMDAMEVADERYIANG